MWFVTLRSALIPPSLGEGRWGLEGNGAGVHPSRLPRLKAGVSPQDDGSAIQLATIRY
jgi:hypothetical protein